jgi:hypothetical protein
MANEDNRTEQHAGDNGGVTDALRAAIDRTLAATGEISKRGQGAREELARRGQEAGAEIARRGQEAREALSRRGVEATGELRSQLEALEKRLASVEERLKNAQAPSESPGGANDAESQPKPEV